MYPEFRLVFLALFYIHGKGNTAFTTHSDDETSQM